MKRGQIVIPKSPLDQKLDEAACIRAEMIELLRKMEEKTAGKPIEKTGQWRQDPIKWLKSHSIKH